MGSKKYPSLGKTIIPRTVFAQDRYMSYLCSTSIQTLAYIQICIVLLRRQHQRDSSSWRFVEPSIKTWLDLLRVTKKESSIISCYGFHATQRFEKAWVYVDQYTERNIMSLWSPCLLCQTFLSSLCEWPKYQYTAPTHCGLLSSCVRFVQRSTRQPIFKRFLKCVRRNQCQFMKSLNNEKLMESSLLSSMR